MVDLVDSSRRLEVEDLDLDMTVKESIVVSWLHSHLSRWRIVSSLSQ